MFFSERINSIEPKDRVLEIGPGATPHPRSDVLLDLVYGSEEEQQAQFGYTGTLNTSKRLVFYNGGVFPFEDKEFDYVICSHVLEHVQDVEFFLNELMRVANKGYLEFPTIYYDYIFNIPVHKNLIYWDGQTIRWAKKNDFSFSEFQPVQSLFLQALEKQAITIVKELRTFLVQGFEWNDNINSCLVNDIRELCFTAVEIQPQSNFQLAAPLKFRERLKIKLKRIIDTYL